MRRYVADNGTVAGCTEKLSHCASSPCQNGGTCRESWKTYECECADGWSGKDCAQSELTGRMRFAWYDDEDGVMKMRLFAGADVGSAWQFSGDGTLSFNPLLRSIQLPWSISLSLRSQQQQAFVMCVQIGQDGYSLIMVSNYGVLNSYFFAFWFDLLEMTWILRK